MIAEHLGFACEARAESPRFSGVAAMAAWRPGAINGVVKLDGGVVQAAPASDVEFTAPAPVAIAVHAPWWSTSRELLQWSQPGASGGVHHTSSCSDAALARQ